MSPARCRSWRLCRLKRFAPEPFLWHVCRGGLTTRFCSLSTGILTMTPLRQRFIEDLQLRNRSPKTIEAYVYHVRELARHFKQSPEQLGDDQVHRYLLHLLHGKQVSWSSYDQAVAALRFFYRVSFPSDTVVRRLPYGKQSKRLPAVRSPQQVALFLDTVHDRTVRIVLRTIYYHGKKDHPKRVTTERPHPTGGLPTLRAWARPREGHGK